MLILKKKQWENDPEKIVLQTDRRTGRAEFIGPFDRAWGQRIA